MTKKDGLIPFATLVLWAGCLVVGVTGLVLPHHLPSPPPATPTPIAATFLNVAISDAPASPTEDASPPSPSPIDPALAPSIATPADAPPLQAVAEPTANIAFALPMKSAGPTVTSAAAVPRHAASAPATASAASTVHRLVYGRGEGQQPAPEYPREAMLAGNEGTVVLRFVVGEDGGVASATVQTPCPFPLLNQAAVRAVRDSWRFKKGPVRSYEVSIQFQLK